MDAKHLFRAPLALAACLGLAAAAFAQPPGPPPGGFGGPGGRGFGPPGGGGVGMLLRSDEVRSELELLDDQVEKLRAVEEEMRDKIRSTMRDRFQGGRRGDRGDREEMRARFDDLRKEAETRVSEVLTTQQMDRLKQIQAQQQLEFGGARALMGGPLAESLGLTEEQQAQLREKAQEVQADLQKKMQEARAEAREQMLEVLTSEQRAKLDELTGAPFTMTRPAFGPPGGRGGRFGDRRRGGRPGPPPPPGGDEL